MFVMLSFFWYLAHAGRKIYNSLKKLRQNSIRQYNGKRGLFAHEKI